MKWWGCIIIIIIICICSSREYIMAAWRQPHNIRCEAVTKNNHVYFYVNFGMLTRWLNVANHNHRFEMINLSCYKIMNDDLSRTMITFCGIILIGCQTGDVIGCASGNRFIFLISKTVFEIIIETWSEFYSVRINGFVW